MIKDKDSIENLKEQIALLYLIKSKALHYLPTFTRTESLPRHSGHTSLKNRQGAHPGQVTGPRQCDGRQTRGMV